MLKVTYRNPLTEVYQMEYAIYMLLTSEFKKVECNSLLLETLRLYYADLVKLNANGNPSYEKQYQMEEKCEALINDNILNKIVMPNRKNRKVIVNISTNEDGTHLFTFRSGFYYFSYCFVLEEIKDDNAKNPNSTNEKKYKIYLRLIDTQRVEKGGAKEKINSDSLEHKGA
ncbi:MAG: hypothetical protein K6G75_09060 [Lachnospiraceae bacterium]|nr:hypothetical protein [Lachnospiraceae bacterium]